MTCLCMSIASMVQISGTLLGIVLPENTSNIIQFMARTNTNSNTMLAYFVPFCMMLFCSHIIE